MAVKVGSARIDENGKAYGGAAGDQTGKELSTQNWYLHKKGWRVFRATDAQVAKKVAGFVASACANSLIGYDQWNRHTLYNAIKDKGFDLSKLTKKVETDCSALVRTALASAGVMGIPEDFRTGNMPSNLAKTGLNKLLGYMVSSLSSGDVALAEGCYRPLRRSGCCGVAYLTWRGAQNCGELLG